MPDYRAMDEALATIAASAPDLRNGLTNHAPMAVEALAAMGRADAVLPWLAGYRTGFLPRPSGRARIERDAWQAALGHEDRFADWVAFFRDELSEAPWQAVVARWSVRLAPAQCAAATHGVIRVAHAARSLAQAETPLRRDELADGLAYWAATHQTLPTAPFDGRARRAADALGAVPVVPPAARRFTGTIVSSLQALEEFAPFAPTIGLLDVTGSVEKVVSDVSETFARVFVANAHDVLTAIVFVHAVTSVAALRSLVPYVPDVAAREAVRWSWQASAALYATFSSAPAAVDVAPPRASNAALVDQAIATRDEHAIKMTEACLREWALRPSPAYLAAAQRASALLRPR